LYWTKFRNAKVVGFSKTAELPKLLKNYKTRGTVGGGGSLKGRLGLGRFYKWPKCLTTGLIIVIIIITVVIN
jgi:hypothetical protein